MIKCKPTIETPVFSLIDQLDPQWVVAEANKIIMNYEPTDYGNNSGKFYKTYETYWFHKSSNIPLIRNFLSKLDRFADQFHSIYSRPLLTDFIFLSRVRDASQPASIFHKDGYFWNGIFHLTIQGDSNLLYIENQQFKNALEIESNDQKCLKFPTGTLWYFNSTPYFHKIGLGKGERLELCAPCAMNPEYVARCLSSVEVKLDGYIDGSNGEWKRNKRHAREYVLTSIAKGRASNNEIAEFAANENDEF